MLRYSRYLALSLLLIPALSLALDPQIVQLSTNGGASLGGLPFADHDVVIYDPTTDSAGVQFNGGESFFGDENIDALHVTPEGNFILSTKQTAELPCSTGPQCGSTTPGRLTFQDEDLVVWDGSEATLLFDGRGPSGFDGDENVDAVSMSPSGNLVLSTTEGAYLPCSGGSPCGDDKSGKLRIEQGDLVEYDLTTGTAQLFFDASGPQGLDAGSTDIDAVHVLEDGTFIFSVSNDKTELPCSSGPRCGEITTGVLRFSDGDLVHFAGGSVSLVFDEALFLDNENIVAVHLPCVDADPCGGCAGAFGMASCLDRYKCYKAKTAKGVPPFERQEVDTEDEFETKRLVVRKPVAYCDPVAKGGQDILDEGARYECFAVSDARTSPRQEKFIGLDVAREDEFVTQNLTVRKPHTLCLPAGANGDGIPSIPAFKCYKAKGAKGTPRFEPRTVELTDEIESKSTVVRRLTHVCSPVGLDGEPIPDSLSLNCYKIKDAPDQQSFAKQSINTTTQFGTSRLDLKKAKELCVPAIEPGSIDSTPVCGDGVVGKPEECDEGTDNSNDPDATCRPDCTLQRCGDGVVDPNSAELCDTDAGCGAGEQCFACAFCESGVPLGPLSFTIVYGPSDADPIDDGEFSILRVTTPGVAAITNGSQGDFTPGPIALVAGVRDPSTGIARLIVTGTAETGASQPSLAGAGYVCYRIRQDPDAIGFVDCDGGSNVDVDLYVDSHGTGPGDPPVVTAPAAGTDSGAGAAMIRILFEVGETAAPSTPCAQAAFEPAQRFVMTTGTSTATIENARGAGGSIVTAVTTVTGQPFDCGNWTEDSGASLTVPNANQDIPIPIFGTLDISQVLRLNDD